MYSYTHEGLKEYVQATSEEILKIGSKKNFNCFEWKSVTNKDGNKGTKIRMIKIEGKNIIPTTKWNCG